MNCSQVKKIIAEYLDGELNETLRSDVKAHLQTCQNCKKAEQALLSIVSPLKQAKRQQVPESVWLNIKESIKEKGQTVLVPNFAGTLYGFFRQKRAVFVPVALAAMLLVAVLFFAKSQISQNELSNYMLEQSDSFSQLTENGIDDLGFSTITDNGLL